MSVKTFFEIATDRQIGQTKYFFLIYDGFPVSPGHILVISKELRQDYFALTEVEKVDLDNAIRLAKQLIEENHSPDGYNIGMNCGEAAGQTVYHFHCHVIPRYKGDMDDPRGGVRHCVQGKGYY
ncbi:HIT family protein [Sphingobacterium wenxiniae]|uniref:Diadenosine tetraphosphate (Ap4A) hydrolase n=1 Tax=Sphingobacterium wenxiniae TaxID=683125 RepID=A0A1I6V6S0_9SPHI|nr:HIT family protein [Sphingobacterium wenxiniae]SFT09401.1 Diadenosine tetraphosphate (Ap4A) hydrolase [Sphingobacterium wenxiniae]